MKDDRRDFGEELAKLRLSRGLSLEDVARDTKIRPALLEALEAGQFDRLPPPVFVAGYLQAYAKRVGMEPDPLVSKYRALVGHAGGDEEEYAPRKPAPSGKPARSLKVTVTILVLGAAVAASVYLWQRLQTSEGIKPSEAESASFPARDKEPVTPEPLSAGPAQEAGEPAPAPSGPAAPQEEPLPAPVQQQAPSQPAAPVGTLPAAVAPPAEPAVPPQGAAESQVQQGDLVLEFSRPCWVELWADGRRKVYRQVGGGERLVLAGRSFKAVTIGDSGAVTLLWHGQPLPFPAGTGKVVRDLEIPPPAGSEAPSP